MGDRFRIEMVVMEDVDEIAEIIRASSQASQSPRIALEFEDCSPSDLLAFKRAGAVSELEGCLANGGLTEFYKIVDYENPKGGKHVIAGIAVWGWDEAAIDKLFSEKARIPRPAGTRSVLRNKFMGELEDMEKRLRPKEKYFELLELVTSPSYRRLGLGTRLINIGLYRADQEGVPCYLSASPMGVSVYKKAGFVDIGRLSIELKEFGGEGTHVHVAMIREPKVSDVRV